MSRRFAALATGVLALGGAAFTPTAALAAKKAPSEERWASMPTPEDHRAAEAEIVRKEGELLRAVVRCAVLDSGELSNCRVLREAPPGSGLGQALLSLTPKYRRKPPKKADLREIDLVDAIFSIDAAPDWVKRPTPDDLMAVFPGEAYRRGQSGQAIINCVVTVQGALKDCVTVDEDPAGHGFGRAAIALTPQLLMKPATKAGAPVEATATIPINFRTYGSGSSGDGKKVLPANLAWAEAPSFADVAAAYPKKARAEGKGGRATLSCQMTQSGRLSKCQVVTSSPRGYGFDGAAKALARQFAYTLNSEADRDAARDLVVHLPFTFDPLMLSDGAPVVGKPTWAAIPSGEQLRAAVADLEAAETARVMLGCVVQPGGALSDCSVVSEEPAGVGVGAAALSLVPSFRLSTWTAEGLPVVGGTVRIPLRFEPGAGPEAGSE